MEFITVQKIARKKRAINMLSCYNCKRPIQEEEDFILKKDTETDVILLCDGCSEEEDRANRKRAEGLLDVLYKPEVE